MGARRLRGFGALVHRRPLSRGFGRFRQGAQRFLDQGLATPMRIGFRGLVSLSIGLSMLMLLSNLVWAQPGASREAWKIAVAAPDGILRLSGWAHGAYHRGYACADFAAAKAVVGAIPVRTQSRPSPPTQSAALTRALRAHGCRPAVGEFQVVALGPEVEIDHGVEAAEFWTALDARAGPRAVGLVFDASPYAIRP